MASDDLQWVEASPETALLLKNRALEAGFEGNDDGSPLWIIRAGYEGDLVPGKLAVDHHIAYIPWGRKERIIVDDFEVCCVHVSKVQWLEDRDGHVPANAVVGGRTILGENLYVGRTWHEGALTPGKIHPSQQVLYISFGGEEIEYSNYEVLCLLN